MHSADGMLSPAVATASALMMRALSAARKLSVVIRRPEWWLTLTVAAGTDALACTSPDCWPANMRTKCGISCDGFVWADDAEEEVVEEEEPKKEEAEKEEEEEEEEGGEEGGGGAGGGW